jgi:hypothetical protein
VQPGMSRVETGNCCGYVLCIMSAA